LLGFRVGARVATILDVGAFVGVFVGAFVGVFVGAFVGVFVGVFVSTIKGGGQHRSTHPGGFKVNLLQTTAQPGGLGPRRGHRGVQFVESKKVHIFLHLDGKNGP
jgi:hypothetical protein